MDVGGAAARAADDEDRRLHLHPAEAREEDVIESEEDGVPGRQDGEQDRERPGDLPAPRVVGLAKGPPEHADVRLEIKVHE